MNIIEENYTWNGEFSKRDRTSYIVLHHAAGSGMSAQQIHQMHIKSNGWAGIGYNFYVRKDGSVYRGRPVDAVGAHCYQYNSQSIGICAEGNFQNEIMGALQMNAISDLLRELTAAYPQAMIVRHGDLNATACPGANYPFDSIVAAAKASPVQAADPGAVNVVFGAKGFKGKLIDDVTYVPLRALAEAMGYTVTWDGNTRTVTIA